MAFISHLKEQSTDYPSLAPVFEPIIEGFKSLITILGRAKAKTDFEEPQQGHLVLMSCGHRGKPDRMEEKRISRLLRKSGFIPMLEELYGLPAPTEKGSGNSAQKPKPRETIDVRLQPPTKTQPTYIPPILPHSTAAENLMIKKIDNLS